jgi:phosphoribosylformylglycinamidine synthase
VRVEDGPKGLAMSTDVNARYCQSDPREGGKQAVAEAWRNIVAVGGKPLAVTDNLNFGNPERPEYMGQFVGALEGIGEACRALDFPIVSGNVSLYNETQGAGILPTPAIGGVGLVDDVSKAVGIGLRAGEALILIGATEGWLGQSAYASVLLGREDGAPPPVDLAAERRNGEFVRAQILNQTVKSCHDLSDGGLAVALAEMCLAGAIGATISSLPAGPAHAILFGEDQARYIVAVSPGAAEALLKSAEAAGAPAVRIGETGGDTLNIAGAAISLADLRAAHENPLPDFMAGKGPAAFGL